MGPRKASSISAHGTAGSPLDGDGGTVLIIDDNAGMLDLLVTLLDAHGFRVLTASNGFRALQVIRESAPRVILTDILMPGQDGLELIREIRRAHVNVKIIAMSGGGYVAKTDYLRYARLLGADATINKPTDTDELIQLLRSFF
jgi:two-component system, response regulator, stage 0 sporulation protein F